MKRLLITLGALCVLALCVTGIILIVRFQLQQAAVRRLIDAGPANLAREEAAARREGIPLTAQELQPPLPPANQNAAPLYMKLTKLLHDKPLDLPKYAEGMDTTHSYTPAQIAAVRRTLAARQDVMTLVHQAADKPQCVFVRDWNKGEDVQSVEYRLMGYQLMRESARLIETESYVMARDGHYKAAVANQARGFRVAEHAASNSSLISYLVGIANESITLRGMQSILALAGPDTAIDADVQRTVAAKQSRLSLRNAIAGEAGFDCRKFDAMRQAEKDGAEAALAAGGFSQEADVTAEVSAVQKQKLPALVDAWQADYLARVRPLIAASNQPPSVRRTACDAANAQAERDKGKPDALINQLPDYIILTDFSKIYQNDTRIRARVAVTLAAAAVLAEKAKTGAFPNTLPPTFIDPYTSKPLNYRREAANGGFVVYSAGPTGAFDGGKPGEKVPGQESVFRYPAVPVPIPADMLK
jgi:hypothetical protein